jgi:hypothetical protein
MWQETHNLLYFNRCGREVLNYGVEIKEDKRSMGHKAWKKFIHKSGQRKRREETI